MHEWDEVAESMLPGYAHWIAALPAGMRTMSAAREYVRQRMLDESVVMRDNIAQSLHRMSGRVQ